MAKHILDTIFAVKSNLNSVLKKHRLQIRSIIKKLIRKFDAQYVQRLLPEQHKKLIMYLEKEKRKAMNKKERNRILALMGEKGITLQEGEGDDAESSEDDDDNILKADGKDEVSDSDDDLEDNLDPR